MSKKKHAPVQWYVVKTVEKNSKELTKEVITTNDLKLASSCLKGSKKLQGLFILGAEKPIATNEAQLNPVKLVVKPKAKPVQRRGNRRNYDRAIA